MGRAHTDREYEAELHRLREQLLLMGAKVEEMIAGSMRALVERDSELARRLIAFDDQIDTLEVETDELCLHVLARRQPVASDLRFLTTALKLVTDLERIGDLAVNTCERVLELNEEEPLTPYVDLPRMSERVQGMVREVLDAFVAGDADRARRVLTLDETIDELYGQLFRVLLTYMMENPRNIFRASRLQSIAKYLERIGDHATNIAEEVVFMIKGKDIRHGGAANLGAHPGVKGLPKGILFLCVHNSARSQMAEAWARRLLPSSVKILSAGSSFSSSTRSQMLTARSPMRSRSVTSLRAVVRKRRSEATGWRRARMRRQSSSVSTSRVSI
ncbi:MAG: phosphate signaling complex protein PhoU [Deltaproteobacteria bacterium]|nr:phosphate signaling complex protein PhoU [Deltaproteobacteria bacterium]